MMKPESPKLLRVSKAAHELGLHPFTVRKWIKQGKIHAVWVGQEARVPRSEIERLVGKPMDDCSCSMGESAALASGLT